MFCTAFVLVATFSLILVFLLLLPSLDPTLWDFTGYVVIESRVYWEQLLYPTKVGVRFAYIQPPKPHLWDYIGLGTLYPPQTSLVELHRSG